LAGAAGGCEAGVCASTGAALSAKNDKATDAAIAEPLITLNPFKVSEAVDSTLDLVVWSSGCLVIS
jgi:hypothetical protein